MSLCSEFKEMKQEKKSKVDDSKLVEIPSVIVIEKSKVLCCDRGGEGERRHVQSHQGEVLDQLSGDIQRGEQKKMRKHEPGFF